MSTQQGVIAPDLDLSTLENLQIRVMFLVMMMGPWEERMSAWEERTGPWEEKMGLWEDETGPWEEVTGLWEEVMGP